MALPRSGAATLLDQPDVGDAGEHRLAGVEQQLAARLPLERLREGQRGRLAVALALPRGQGLVVVGLRSPLTVPLEHRLHPFTRQCRIAPHRRATAPVTGAGAGA